MAFAISICCAVLITLPMFYKEYKATDQSPLIFLLSLILLLVLCSLTDVAPTPFTKNPRFLIVIAVGMLLVVNGTNTFKVLTNMPSSAYKALMPVAICLGIILFLGLVAVL